METKNKKTIRQITRLILTNEQKMIRAEDLRNLCDESMDFELIINQIYQNLKDIGLDLISSTFLEEKYYILTSEGKDDNITPSQYGSLAIIIALSKEIDGNLRLEQLKDIFSEVWESDIKFLIDKGYLHKIEIDDLEIIKVSPLGKALFKNILEDLKLDNLLQIFKKE
ncbi:MAG: hypothetical protein GF317_22425 [Candidatus Lokiarchaeota archaeon]|nr:hypothetical protein [Candidatus Lokiarchaeota archaeon]MBD3202217.1 hypothetical protein [Candidatus Lokiarchaeota archaeon]